MISSFEPTVIMELKKWEPLNLASINRDKTMETSYPEYTNTHSKFLTLLLPQKLLRFTWPCDPLALIGCLSVENSPPLAAKDIPGSNEDSISPIDKGISLFGVELDILLSSDDFSTFMEPFSFNWSDVPLFNSIFALDVWSSLGDSPSDSSPSKTCLPQKQNQLRWKIPASCLSESI